MGKPPRWTRAVLGDADLEAISRAILRWGGRTDPLERARRLFTHLGMHRTAERHGVLVYLALEDRKLAIVGDGGIHARVGDQYWRRVCDLMLGRLRAGAIRDGIVLGITEVGRVLSEHFPRRPDDTNELSDEVSVS
ncbi:MAG: hypothetical protein AUG00_06305 [Candidatus Rokubacteria bacterium 13_1_20CM_2_70_7]|nr:MAG: hypothetical protein AUG00_06305 [Candidatus Rokubacteria bacterium 13_1_20CM_2_70_7]